MTYAPTRTLKDRVVVVTGASRGIGREMAVRAGADGAKVALLARTVDRHPKITGTLAETAAAITAAGGTAVWLACDVRDNAAVAQAIGEVAHTFGGIDVIINNAGALDLRQTPQLAPASFDRLLAINVEGPFAVVHAAYEHLCNSDNPHVLNVSPPLNLHPSWFQSHVGHTVGKYAESMLTLGWAAEFASIPIAVNSLWPATTVASTGMLAAMGDKVINAQARTPNIMADAAHAVVTRPAAQCSGHFFTDEQVLVEAGVTDLSGYRLAACEEDLVSNFYLQPVRD